MLQTTDLEFGRLGGFTLRTQALDVAPGKILGILGPNGSGKSTLLQLLTGTLKPNKGRVTWAGMSRRRLGARGWARRIAAVPQQSGTVPDMRVRQYVSLGLIPQTGVFGSITDGGYETVEQALRICEVDHLAEVHVSDLSGGQQQRVRIAKALAQTPQTLVLDEPANHLDLQAIGQLAQLLHTLARNGLAIVVSMHDIDLASQLADDVLVLQQGRTLAVGNTDRVLTPELIQQAWGVEMLVVEDGPRRRYLLKY